MRCWQWTSEALAQGSAKCYLHDHFSYLAFSRKKWTTILWAPALMDLLNVMWCDVMDSISFFGLSGKGSIPMITSYARLNTNLDTFCRILDLILHRRAKNSNHLHLERAGRHKPEWGGHSSLIILCMCVTQPQFYRTPVCQPCGQNILWILAKPRLFVYAENRLEELTFPLAAHGALL